MVSENLLYFPLNAIEWFVIFLYAWSFEILTLRLYSKKNVAVAVKMVRQRNSVFPLRQIVVYCSKEITYQCLADIKIHKDNSPFFHFAGKAELRYLML